MSEIKDKISKLIKDSAKENGFDACGIAPAAHLDAESAILKDWLSKDYHATMSYMNRNVEKRLNPVLLNDWARSVIIVLYNYFPAETQNPDTQYKFAKYAYGKDYHDVIKEKLRQIVFRIEDEIGEISARVFVDSAPVLEKAWAKKCGLGWIGKNGCLINRDKGSFFFIGVIITGLDLSYDEPEMNDYCGNCKRCVDACPTQAIISPGIIDAGKCISYLSIEHKGELPDKNGNSLHGWVFGCDICQDVCPWNRFSLPHKEAAFKAKQAFLDMDDPGWERLNEDSFTELFKGTAVERTGYERLKRNIEQGIGQ
ncbi:MAG: tRNA epoxyqueuosine(34) reductase QueG [Bacteroidetes bacterium]|nr:tRNA epoxyqueuosine(34) reductase QueG [Bacteroidota bacterium]